VAGLLDRRLLFVTGKGGTGKSTVAIALGLLAAGRGQRTIVAEIAGQDRARGAIGSDPTGAPGATLAEAEVAPGLFTISIDPEAAMEEYLRLRTGVLGQALGSSRLFQAFAMATPGMRELLTMGKAWELAQERRRSDGADPYDLVIVDAPASGHGAGILRTPRTFAEIARVGPVADLAQRIAATLADPVQTGVVAIATAEEMPVNETLWLRDALAADGRRLDAVIVNALYARRFGPRDQGRLARALDGAGAASPARAALGAALSQARRRAGQDEQLTRLHAELGDDVAVPALPYLFSETIGRPELEQLAAALGSALDGVGRAA
jgi:anion-transporting  ArsA/GET3 family ATPase